MQDLLYFLVLILDFVFPALIRGKRRNGTSGQIPYMDTCSSHALNYDHQVSELYEKENHTEYHDVGPWR